ncbi:hypothetical protein [Deinococcus ficus]|uniref:hypothetical protein n=1 Tax=Deinococcus ficus TaxID=317577 RepID=UPI000421249D|nr:hypothetical protein [Deinococcus ficus]
MTQPASTATLPGDELLLRYQALRAQRTFRQQRQPPQTALELREQRDQLLFPIDLPLPTVDELLDRLDDLAEQYRLDTFDLMALMLAHGMPQVHKRSSEPDQALGVVALRLDRLRALLDVAELELDMQDQHIGETRGPAAQRVLPTPSKDNLLLRLRFHPAYRGLSMQRPPRRALPADDTALKSFSELDEHAGIALLRMLLPKANLAPFEGKLLLAHAGLWALRQATAQEELTRALNRALRVLRGKQDIEASDHVNALRTGRGPRYFHNPLLKLLDDDAE